MNAQVANTTTSTVLDWTEQGLVPDTVIRAGIRQLCRRRLKEIQADDIETAAIRLDKFVQLMDVSPVALLADRANEQHYEVPAEFFSAVLGPHRKYSCGFWADNATSLEEAEEAALRISCERAGIEDGMDILDLGCGWGSLSLCIARHYPACRITSVSNSAPQREFILAEAKRRGLTNLEVLTADMNAFATSAKFDRIVSVEMFEHMRNYRTLFRRVNSWLKPDGRFFLHIFCHRSTPYEFLDQGASDWMSRHFFSGGMMPSDNLPLRFQEHLQLEQHNRWNGVHYEKTANAWLTNMDRRREEIMPILRATYGDGNAARWFQRWRLFFMACAELFGHNGGDEWFVSHYVFRRGENQVAERP